MSIEYVKGDIFQNDCEIMMQQVNTFGIMESGLGLQVKNKFPNVYAEYKNYCMQYLSDMKALLGTIRIGYTDTFLIAHLFCQNGINSSKQTTDYDRMFECFIRLKDYMLSNDFTRLAIPYKIGCGNGGGKWEFVVEKINKAFEGMDFAIKIYDFNK
ncbi:MAG: hypothetical protein Ta2D_09940 [Rickettsiales bacterium]|nr:MAG: hypothetical protein Ta2D_09940 [Rickettsiales bacterium]